MKHMRKILAIVLVVAMVMGLGVTAFATDGAYSVTLYANGSVASHNPMTGADYEIDGNYCYLTIYCEEITVYGVTAHLTSLTVAGVAGEGEDVGGVGYDDQFTFKIPTSSFKVGEEMSITYGVSYNEHATYDASIVLTARE